MKKQTNAPRLPAWNLGDLYVSPSAPALKRDLAKSAAQATRFQKTYQGTLARLSGDALAASIAEYEALDDVLGRLSSYAQLLYSEDMNKPKNTQFYQNVTEQVTDISTALVFFTLELNKIADNDLAKKLKASKKLQHYQPWLEEVREFRKYQLSDELERLLHEKTVTGYAAWVRLFDETIAAMRFPFEGKQLTEPEIMDWLYHKDGAKRKKAAKSIGKELSKTAPVFTLITNTLAKDKDIEDRWRKFREPISSRNLDNRVEDDVVEALMSAVKKSYPKLSHRYYKLKAQWMGGKKLAYWDRNAPLPWEDDRKWTWDEAETIVLESYAAFSLDMAKIGKQFFDKRWIDAQVRPGKSTGAFSHPTVPSAHPYILMSYQGKTRDVMTLAHELGHGVHQVLAAKQGALMADTPLTLAETASVFGEQLVFQEILKREKNAKFRKALIAKKVEDMLNTVVRQVAFCQFEKRVHADRKKGELTTDQINAHWMAVQKESLGPALQFSPEYGTYWSYIPHFIHTPFYVYAYAFGDCLVNALYAVYQKEQKSGRGKVFEKKYLAMLSEGGRLRHKELLKPFGLDISKPAFWQQGLDIIAGYIGELE